jgi:hypothetical protein
MSSKRLSKFIGGHLSIFALMPLGPIDQEVEIGIVEYNFHAIGPAWHGPGRDTERFAGLRVRDLDPLRIGAPQDEQGQTLRFRSRPNFVGSIFAQHSLQSHLRDTGS